MGTTQMAVQRDAVGPPEEGDYWPRQAVLGVTVGFGPHGLSVVSVDDVDGDEDTATCAAWLRELALSGDEEAEAERRHADEADDRREAAREEWAERRAEVMP